MKKLLLALLLPAALFAQKPAVDYVNPMIGTAEHGHTFPGATVPFGMVQLSPDNGRKGWDWCSGYHYSEDKIIGFANTHLSGTGCADLGDILFMPGVSVNPPEARSYSSKFKHTNEKAEAGYYSVILDDKKIKAELTATNRVGVQRYTFPKTIEADIVVNLGYGNDDTPLETFIQVDGTNQISGYRFSKGWANNQKIFFTATFSKPFSSSYVGPKTSVDNKHNNAKGKDVFSVLRFDASDGQPIVVKVAISCVSIDGAKKNLAAEAADKSFDDIRAAAKAAWQTELERVDVDMITEGDKTTFYTAMYHSMLAPTTYCDVDGQYRGPDDQVHIGSFTNYCTFSLWDTFRAEHPLFTITQPKRIPDMVNSLMSFQEQGGLLPVWTLQGCETNCMIGYHSIPVITDAYLKGIPGFDINKAYDAMKKSAFSGKNGLGFYASSAPQPFNDAVAFLKKEYRFPENKYLVGDENVVSGYTTTISGQQLTYHSAHPLANSSIIARCGDGNRVVEWQGPAIANKNAKTVTYVWLAGMASNLGAHKFDLYVNGKKLFDFNSFKDSTSTGWVKLGQDGAKLSFRPTFIDQYQDVFGMMYLEIPLSLTNGGQPVKFKVEGEDAGSRDFFFVHQYELGNKLTIEKEFAIGIDGKTQKRFVKLELEYLGKPTTAEITWDNDVTSKLSTTLYPGVNIVWVPLEIRAKKIKHTFNVKADGLALTNSIELEPMGNNNYIPADKEHESVSKALEYAYDDWCIAQVAKALGKTADYDLFMTRANYYKNYYDKSTGFMRGKRSNGDWVSPFNPMFATNKQPEYTEGNAWQYTWFVPHDVDGLITLMGGKDRFTSRLDTLFTQKLDLGPGAPPDVSGLIGLYAHGNEPSHHIAYLYAAAGKPAKTQAMVRKIMRTMYNDTNGGLCGNEDCGQMSAWYVFSALGFYPLNPADGKYYVGSPMVKKATLKLDNGKTFVVDTQNQAEGNVYVKQILLNGKELATPFITHKDILEGGKLEFIMSDKAN